MDVALVTRESSPDLDCVVGATEFATDKPSLRAIDLFAGAGGLSFAALCCGIRVLAAVEMDRHACATYRANLIAGRSDTDSRPKLYPCDVRSLEPKRVLDAHFTQDEPCDLILGGPPCQGFSVHHWPPPRTHGSEKDRQIRPDLLPWCPASTVFVAAPEGDENDLHMKHSAALTARFAATPENGGSRRDAPGILPCHQNHDGHSDVYGRIDPAQPAPTMTTACINPSKGRFVHPTEPHGITVRQAARLQTFPDHFVFKGGLMAAGEQIGNAVPVELGRHLLWAVQRGLGVSPRR